MNSKSTAKKASKVTRAKKKKVKPELLNGATGQLKSALDNVGNLIAIYELAKDAMESPAMQKVFNVVYNVVEKGYLGLVTATRRELVSKNQDLHAKLAMLQKLQQHYVNAAIVLQVLAANLDKLNAALALVSKEKATELSKTLGEAFGEVILKGSGGYVEHTAQKALLYITIAAEAEKLGLPTASKFSKI
nr:hypothetical protein [uncultured Rhodoferax sp.]